MNHVDAPTVAAWLRDGGEIAFLDVREHGQYGESHPLRVVSLPYSVLEARVGTLVPRRTTRTVVLDAGDGVAERAARRLEALGYDAVHVLAGGHPAWRDAGLEVYKGVNVPSKAFGEAVEHTLDTPRIEPEALDRMRSHGRLVILDGRTPGEFARMSIPGAINVPNGELVYRIHDIAPDPATTVVVNCAGRTRSIIGAQTLLNAGIANRVVALKGGTMAWRLAGLELDHGSVSGAPEVSAAGLERARAMAGRLRERYRLPVVDAAALDAMRRDDSRTTYLLDVRGEAEYLAGHFPDARHAPGGQLVQATDEWCAVWGARIVLVDEGSGVRATTTAHWLAQMSWEVHVLMAEPALASETGRPAGEPLAIPAGVPVLDVREAEQQVRAGSAVLVDVDDSALYRSRRLPGAVWGCRPRIDRVAAALAPDTTAILYSEHETRARLAARDLAETGRARVAVLGGGREAWCASGRPTVTAEGEPPDSERIDHLFWVHDRHQGNDEAAREYLRWEENLPSQLARSGEQPYPIAGP